MVQPGVVLADLNRVLSPQGLWFAPDPSSQDFCTLGGMLSNNSKGAHSVKYGPTVRHVRWLRMLLADGTEVKLEDGFRPPGEYSHPALRRIARLIVNNRRRIDEGWPLSRTNSSGYNLKDCLNPVEESVNLVPLFVGSEGTLAVILEAGLRLTPLPGHRSLSLLEFANPAEAAVSVIELLPGGP